MKVEAPWPFVSDLPKDGTLRVNLPDPDGIELGKSLARFADAADAADRCDECAFKLGTLPNGCMSTVADALKCALEGVPFYCHKHFDTAGKPTQLCAGYVALRRESAK